MWDVYSIRLLWNNFQLVFLSPFLWFWIVLKNILKLEKEELKEGLVMKLSERALKSLNTRVNSMSFPSFSYFAKLLRRYICHEHVKVHKMTTLITLLIRLNIRIWSFLQFIACITYIPIDILFVNPIPTRKAVYSSTCIQN